MGVGNNNPSQRLVAANLTKEKVMKTILLTLAATALTLIATSASQASPKASPAHSESGSMHTNFKDYHLSHGTKFDHGFFYKGKNHEHWGETRFDHRFGCNVYWDRGLATWFYWCERDICFYPVSYCPYRTYVCPPIVAEPARPIIRPLVVEPVRPVAAPVPVAAPAPVAPTVNVRVNVQVNAQTTSALPIPEAALPR
jgi:hypothetical protein